MSRANALAYFSLPSLTKNIILKIKVGGETKPEKELPVAGTRPEMSQIKSASSGKSFEHKTGLEPEPEMHPEFRPEVEREPGGPEPKAEVKKFRWFQKAPKSGANVIKLFLRP